MPHMAAQPVRVLSIAGSDSGGGAGIQADIKTITMMGGHAMTAITALTAQNSQGVTDIASAEPDMVAAQIDAVVSDFGVDAVKIGMLGSAAIAEVVADRLEQLGDVPIVFDPVMVATSGAALADQATIAAFARLMQLSAVTTPNLPELEALGGEITAIAKCQALLIKGGHGEDGMLTDRLIERDGQQSVWSNPKITTAHSHGTGCTLSSAIALGLGQGMCLYDAITLARRFVRLALHDAPDLVSSNGPMGHYTVRNDAVMAGPLLNQITLGCSDYAASCTFYRTLGLMQIVDSPPRYARFEAPNGTTLSIHEIETQAAIGSGHAVYLEHHDLDGAVARLRAAGLEISAAVDQRWNWREAWLVDPAGNRICLYHAGEDRRHPPWRVS